uniref:Uncharacterized protein n=1 Tax=Rhizophora mucronata TaxID=61149 RepID=A0A2P2R0I6_RHIMU
MNKVLRLLNLHYT